MATAATFVREHGQHGQNVSLPSQAAINPFEDVHLLVVDRLVDGLCENPKALKLLETGDMSPTRDLRTTCYCRASPRRDDVETRECAYNTIGTTTPSSFTGFAKVLKRTRPAMDLRAQPLFQSSAAHRLLSARHLALTNSPGARTSGSIFRSLRLRLPCRFPVVLICTVRIDRLAFPIWGFRVFALSPVP